MKREEFLDNLNDDFLGCRDLRHAWGRSTWYQEPDGEVLRVVTCDRCGTRRIDEIDVDEPSGVIGRQYEYPKGYQWHRDDKTDDRLSSRDVRREALSRVRPIKIQDRSGIPRDSN